MKKIAFILFSLMAIGTAQATDLSTVSYTITGGDSGACTLLGENVKIGLSSNVRGAYECSTTAPAGVSIATCHSGGRTASRAYTCTAADVEAETAGCSEANVSINKTGPVFAVASSIAPSVSSYFPGAGSCDGTAANSAASTKLTADKTAAGS